MRLTKLSILASALALALSIPAHAQVAPDEDDRLQACIDKTATDAENAYEDGIAWMMQTGTAASRHCTALALVALGQEEEGAARLETLANAKDGGTMEQRGIYLAQAGNAWPMAGAPEAAVTTLTNALKISPKDADLHKDRARAYLAMKKWKEGGQDLDVAIELSPGDVDAYLMRGRALLQMKRYDDALKDAERAMKQAPKNVDAIVLRGDILEAQQTSAEVLRTQ